MEHIYIKRERERCRNGQSEIERSLTVIKNERQ